MIKANELRIGNIVLNKDNVVKFISHRKISDIASNPENHGYKPIPLSPAVLEASGFEMNQSRKRLCYPYDVGFSLAYYDGILYNYDTGTIIKCNYLHQLQNLIFALTGFELQVDPIKLSIAVTGVYNEAGEPK